MENVIGGLVVTLLTEGAKRVNAVPINENQKGRVRALVGVLSILVAVLTAYVDGTLLNGDTLNVVGNALSNWILATVAYYGLVK